MRNALKMFMLGVTGLALLVGAAGQATARQVITFDGSTGGFADPGQTLSVSGFNFTPQNGAGSFLIVSSQSDIVGNGTNNLFAANHTLLTVDTSSPFSLTSFDIGGSFKAFPDRWASSVLVTGQLAGGGTVSTTVTLPTDPVLETFVLPSTFTGLTSVLFSPNANLAFPDTYNYEFVLDNITVNGGAVPEPATIISTGIAGAIGLVVTAWRRRKAVIPTA